MEEESRIALTYENLFDILRREKDREELQPLEENFFKNVIDYLNEKNKILAEHREQEGLFEAEEKEKIKHQLNNIKKILKGLYDRREKKIIDMALNKSRTKSNIIDASTLLDEERLFYEMLVSLLDSKREEILHNLLKGQLPSSIKRKPEEEKTEAKEETGEFKSADELKNETKLVRFLYPVPKFIGVEEEEYGPFEEEDVANLPNEIAEVLITKGRAEEIKEE